VNALADDKVADYVNENFIATYLKVGTFQVINGRKVGGNVASYFCLFDGSVVHAVPGKVDGAKLLSEARWAVETRKLALTRSTNLASGAIDMPKYKSLIKEAHEERFVAEQNGGLGIRAAIKMPGGGKIGPIAGIGSTVKPKMPNNLPANMPRGVSQQAQAHWLLATSPLAKIDTVYPIVWETILRERLSGLPVVKR
jgi:hypothetical protein